jgi:hypothetical protein
MLWRTVTGRTQEQILVRVILTPGRLTMDQDEDRSKLEREIERAKRLAASVTDRTTAQRLWAFVDELKQRLKRRLAARQAREEIKARAHELWVQHGRPPGRDLEFWLQAEAEKRESGGND